MDHSHSLNLVSACEMLSDNVKTPQNNKSTFWEQLRKSGAGNNSARSLRQKGNKLQPSTPRASSSSLTLMSLVGSTTSCTPPAKRFPSKVRNPFEAAWVERLHLPVIASPSLFQRRPTTPQLSSTHFEWTIDEVSQLQPAHVEPHETQFHDSPDPEFESKAQIAISSYFKEQQIVPSPVDCPLRSQRIILSEIDTNTPISKPRRIRDCQTQTELTLPPILPAELEEALRPYFKPHLAGVGRELKAEVRHSTDAANNSMRRKLFELVDSEENKSRHNNFVGSSPSSKQTIIAGKLSESLDKSSFGSLSPISNLVCLSPCSPRSLHSDSSQQHKLRQPNFREGDVLSPIVPENLKKNIGMISKTSYRTERANLSEHLTLAEIRADHTSEATPENFTPDRSSSPMRTLNFSTDQSFNQRVSRLRVNSSQRSVLSTVCDISMVELDTDTEDAPDIGDEDDIQELSQVSLTTSLLNCSSSNSDTPRKRRAANRKNLSQSFNANWTGDDEDNESDATQPQSQPTKIVITKLNEVTKRNDEQRVAFYRTDSGFNETSSLASSQEQNSQEVQL